MDHVRFSFETTQYHHGITVVLDRKNPREIGRRSIDALGNRVVASTKKQAKYFLNAGVMTRTVFVERRNSRCDRDSGEISRNSEGGVMWRGRNLTGLATLTSMIVVVIALGAGVVFAQGFSAAISGVVHDT